jgi:hypothetical protein
MSSWITSVHDLFDRQGRRKAVRTTKRREKREGHQVEQLEQRRVMAFDLVAAYAESATPFYVKDVSPGTVELNDAPQQIVLRFGPGVEIDAATLGAISVVRSGGAGDAIGNGNDVAIVPGSVTVDDAPNQNQVVLRFAETLVDDTYRITVGAGLGSAANGSANPTSFDLRLDLGAFVTAVVPQPALNNGGSVTQYRRQIHVYFNAEDPLLATSAQNPAFYRLFEMDAAGTDVAAAVNPRTVVYDATLARATLVFEKQFVGGRTFRLEVGGAGSLPAAATVLETDDVVISGNSSFSTAQNLGTLTGAGATVSGEISVRATIATPAGDLSIPSQNGTLEEPGHRENDGDSGSHGSPFATVDPATGIKVVSYNFRSDYGFDPQGNPLQNAITEAQKQRAREIFELYSLYTGIRFVETEFDGITVVTGDMRALSPTITTAPAGLASVGDPNADPLTGMAIMDSTENWGASEYGGSWFRVAMHEIGHTLGLTHAYDVPCVMGAGLPGEPVFPGDYDINHIRQFYQPDGTDIDLYRFTLAEAGRLTAETVIARPGEVIASTLDSVLSLYKQEVVNGRTVRTLVARNDDYYGRDSFVGLDLAAGTYFIAVTSVGNTDINPEVSDSGSGGRSDGGYELRIGFTPASTVANSIVDLSGTPLDGDRDGVEGGTFKFWFNTAGLGNTVFVSKTATPGGNGTPESPYVTNSIKAALDTFGTKKILRILGNSANIPYLIGTDLAGRPLPDGAEFNVPAGATVMIDPGAILKFRAANIDVGSSSELVSRANASLQVLGTPAANVVLTSYHDDSVGGNSDGFGPAATGGQWGGIVFRKDSDVASGKAFVNTVSQARFTYGGGQVRVDSQLAAFSPIQVEGTRPTIAFNTITGNANAAIAATPNSFEDADGRVGPELRGNRITGNSINGVFVKIDTGFGRPLETLDVPARFKSTDVVYVLQENLVVNGGAGGYYVDALGDTRARLSGRLAIDPGAVVKLGGARIEVDRGMGQVIAEGLPNNRVIFTSLGDNRFGAGGTFDTNGNLPDAVAPGDWGGFMLNAGAKASIDNAYIAFGGGSTPLEGGFDSFNVIEAHQAELRLASTRVEQNAAGQATTDRTGRGGNAAATVFVRGAQPIIVGNDFRANAGAVVSINANSLTDAVRPDTGRSTGGIARNAAHDANFGPLIRDNRLAYSSATSATAGVVVRGEEITVESVWDDTDIVHVLTSEIVVKNLHSTTGLRLQSKADQSLVVKMLGANAGITASGFGLDIDDRVGGTVQVVGQPGFPVIITSLRDDSVGVSLDPLGNLVKDTNNNGTDTTPAAGDWRSLKFLPYSNDRNVSIFVESERALTGGVGSNETASTAQPLGVLAPNFATGTNTWESAQEKSGDENRRLGFEVHGFVSPDMPTDVDVYQFSGYAGSEVWIDVDKTSGSLDTVVELLDASGRVLARSVDSVAEGVVVQGEIQLDVAGGDTVVYQLAHGGVTPGTLTGTIYEPGFPFPVAFHTFAVDAAGDVSIHNLFGADRLGAAVAPTAAVIGGTFDAATGQLTLVFDGPVGATYIETRYAYQTGVFSAATTGAAQPLAKDAWRGGDFYSQNPKDAGLRVILPGTQGTSQQYFVRVRSQAKYEPVATAATNGGVTATTLPEYQATVANASAGASVGRYVLQVRLRQQDEKPGSTVRYADLRFPTTAIEVQGLPANSNLVGETGENSTDDNGTYGTAQYVGNLLQSDRNTISVSGSITDEADVHWYTFALNAEGVQSIGGVSQAGGWATMFDIDYGDGFRGDLTISVFDDQGRLIYVGRDSDVADDQPGTGQGNDFDDLSKGSVGKLDPFIGTTRLPAGLPSGATDYKNGGAVAAPNAANQVRYYVAVSSNERLPTALNATFVGSALNSLIRLEPISSLDKVVEDRVGPAGGDSIIDAKADTFSLAVNVTPFTLSDVTLFVSTASSLVTADPMRGGRETTIVANYGQATTIGDLILRSDGSMWAYAGVRNAANLAGRLDRVDTGTGARTTLGNDQIPNRDPNAGTPANANEVDVAPQGAGASASTTFTLANQNVAAATVQGTLELTGAFPAGSPSATATWTFQGALGGGITFTPVSVPAGFPSPVLGNVNGVLGTISITWDAVVPRGGVKIAAIDYTYVTDPPDPETVTTDTVDALAWQRTGVQDYDNLYFSVRDGGVSRLYRANPANGDAKITTGQPWGYKGFIQDAGGSLGVVHGMAFLGGQLYGVDSNGYFFTINPGSGDATLIDLDPTTPDVADPLPGVEFRGMAVGPQNLGGGVFANLLFTIDAGGMLRALDETGVLRPIFDADGNGVAGDLEVDSTVGGATGLAFSTLDVNLWHPTDRRKDDAGHGINASPDDIRTSGTTGGTSMYFGFEQYVAGNPPYGGYAGVNGQYGAVAPNWQEDLASNPYTNIGNNYNVPGGAQGSLTTNAFSLAGYTYTDKPTLYFNYWLETQNASGKVNEMRDSARVLVSIDGGLTWELVATNNQARSRPGTEDAELPVSVTASSQITSYTNQKVQELFDTAGWRQARIDLGDYAGEGDVRLRFDFATAGECDPTDAWRTSKVVAAAVADATLIGVGDVSNLYLGLTMVGRDGTPLGLVIAIDELTNEVELDTPVTLNANDIVTFVDGTGTDRLNNIPNPFPLPGQALANTTGDLGSPTRGQNNDYEGFYIDDIVVGFAERGEMVTAANANQAGFFDIGTSGADAQVLQGSYQLEIRRGTEYTTPNSLPVSVFQTFDTNDRLIPAFSTPSMNGSKVGDQNLPRQQGQFVIENNIISDAAAYGIAIDAAARDGGSDMPHPGVARSLPVLNNSRLVPGVVVANNVIASSGTGGVLFSGDPNTGSVPTAVVPYGRIVNNTIYGGATQRGVGVNVTQNAGPTLINNLFANLATGVSVDATSRVDGSGNQRTVVATSAFYNVGTQVNGVTQNQQIVLSGDPFVNALARNFYLAPGSEAIDSALNSLQDRNEFVVVNSPLGIPASPILSPDRDLYGQLRSDDPTQASAPGLGGNVFKDRGAIDRVDTTQPYATLAVPLDNGSDDLDPTADAVIAVRTSGRSATQFEIQLADVGVGIDLATVTGDAFSITRDGVPLLQGVDYVFRYLETSNRVVLESSSVFPFGTYVITLTTRPSDPGLPGLLTDLANNTLLPNRDDGTRAFTIQLADVPGAPWALVGTPGENAVALSWNAPSWQGTAPIVNYRVQYSTDGGTTWTTFPRTTPSAETSIVVTGLTNGTGYIFRVAAVNAVGRGDYSAPTGVITPQALPPAAPTGLSATRISSGTVGVSWTAPPSIGTAPITDYVVEYSVNGGTSWTTFPDGVGTGTTATLSGLTNGVSHLIRVAAVNKNGTGAWAGPVAITPLAPASAPTITSLTAGNAAVAAAWSTPSGNGSPITGYVVEWTSTAGGGSLSVGAVNATTITGLTNGADYSVRVAAVTAYGVGAWSAYGGPVTPLTTPAAPTGVTAIARDGGALVSWTPPSDTGGRPITNYVVQYRLATAGSWTTVSRPVSTAATQTVAGLTNGKSYVFRVAAVSSVGTGGYSAESGAVTPQPLAAAPTRLTGTAGNGQVSLVWTAPSNTGGLPISDYLVQYSTDGGSTWVTANDGVSTIARATVTGLVNGRAHIFRVAAITAGGIGAFSVASRSLTPVG